MKAILKIKKVIPNILTVLRIILIPILVASFYFDGGRARCIVLSIFIFASITDYIDGMLARKWGAHSSFGRMLDPIADKMLVVSTLVMMIEHNLAPAIPIIAIICREIFVSGMREFLSGVQFVLKVNLLGKCKTAMQMIAIIILLLAKDSFNPRYFQIFGQIFLWATAVLTVISGFLYSKEGFKYIDLNLLNTNAKNTIDLNKNIDIDSSNNSNLNQN